MSKLDYALAAIQRNWHVYPVVPGMKQPLIADMLNRASKNPDDINIWWANTPSANIGIATGPSGLVVIDIDVPKTDTQELFGIEAWAHMLDMTGIKSEPKTYEVSTPSGGIHLYFKANERFNVKTKASALAPGIDVRALGGSIIAAGSETRKGNYVVVRGIDPRPLPSWLRTELRAKGLATAQVEVDARTPAPPVKSTSKYAQAAFTNELKTFVEVGDGARNDQLFRSTAALGRFIGGELDYDGVYQAFYEAAVLKGLKHHEAASTIKSGLRKK